VQGQDPAWILERLRFLVELEVAREALLDEGADLVGTGEAVCVATAVKQERVDHELNGLA
jgi:hypothetical protein